MAVKRVRLHNRAQKQLSRPTVVDSLSVFALFESLCPQRQKEAHEGRIVVGTQTPPLLWLRSLTLNRGSLTPPVRALSCLIQRFNAKRLPSKHELPFETPYVHGCRATRYTSSASDAYDKTTPLTPTEPEEPEISLTHPTFWQRAACF